MPSNSDFGSLSIGLIGCGKWGRHILRDLCALGARVRVAAPSEETRSFALAHGAESAHQSIAEVMHLCDGYIVATPLTNHYDSIRTLAASDKPIFCEKALTNSAEKAEELVALCGDRLFVMDKWRYHPGVQKIKELIDAGALGKLSTVRTSRLGWGIIHDDVDASWVLLPHDLSIILHILGNIPPVTAITMLDSQRPELGMMVVLQDSDGPRVIVEYSIIHPESKRMLVVSGDRGSVALPDSYSPEVLMRPGRLGGLTAALEKIPADGPMPLLEEIRHFLQYLHGGPTPMSSAQEAAQIVRRITEIREMAGMP